MHSAKHAPATAALTLLLSLLFALGTPAASLRAQSAVDSPPNVSHGWVVPVGTIQFQLLHRFNLGPAPTRKLINAPTLTLASGFSSWGVIGFNYASNSELTPAFPNEWEFFARAAAMRQESGAPMDLYIQAGQNTSGESTDGGIVIARRMGRLRLIAQGSVFTHPYNTDDMRFSAGGGLVLKVSEHSTISGDAVTLVDRTGAERVGWSAGVQAAVPYTPHTISLHASNVASRTLEGIAQGGAATRYGFEYTIPITMRRYMPQPSSASSNWRSLVRSWAPAASDTVVIDIKAMSFGKKLEVPVGTTVLFRNKDAVAHNIVGDNSTFDSGSIAPNGTWTFTFKTVGIFNYHCVPHPFMRGTIVVR